MEKILSQDEINALFSSMSAGGSALGDAADKGNTPGRDISKYDFCRSDRMGKDQARVLHQIHTRFARHYSASLSAYLRTAVEVALVSVDQISYLEFMKLVTDPTLFCSVSLAPLHGHLGMEFTPPLTFPVLDLMLGGTGNLTFENRPLTELEMQLAEGLVKLALRDLTESWRPILEIAPQLAGMETKPQLVQLVPASEPVVAVVLAVKLNEISGMLNLCLPAVILKTNRAAFEPQKRPRSARPEAGEAGKIGEALRSARVTMTGEIRDQVFCVEDLLNLAVGDVIQLNHGLGDPVQLSVGGIPKFQGRIVARRGKRSFEVSHKFAS
jgi:flagellar motor switch protein FliM